MLLATWLSPPLLVVPVDLRRRRFRLKAVGYSGIVADLLAREQPLIPAVQQARLCTPRNGLPSGSFFVTVCRTNALVRAVS